MGRGFFFIFLLQLCIFSWAAKLPNPIPVCETEITREMVSHQLPWKFDASLTLQDFEWAHSEQGEAFIRGRAYSDQTRAGAYLFAIRAADGRSGVLRTERRYTAAALLRVDPQFRLSVRPVVALTDFGEDLSGISIVEDVPYSLTEHLQLSGGKWKRDYVVENRETGAPLPSGPWFEGVKHLNLMRSGYQFRHLWRTTDLDTSVSGFTDGQLGNFCLYSPADGKVQAYRFLPDGVNFSPYESLSLPPQVKFHPLGPDTPWHLFTGLRTAYLVNPVTQQKMEYDLCDYKSERKDLFIVGKPSGIIVNGQPVVFILTTAFRHSPDYLRTILNVLVGGEVVASRIYDLGFLEDREPSMAVYLDQNSTAHIALHSRSKGLKHLELDLKAAFGSSGLFPH